MRDDSLRERVAAAPQERHLSENMLTAYRRGWLKFDRLVGSRRPRARNPAGRGAGIPRGGDPRTKRFHAPTSHATKSQNHSPAQHFHRVSAGSNVEEQRARASFADAPHGPRKLTKSYRSL